MVYVVEHHHVPENILHIMNEHYTHTGIRCVEQSKFLIMFIRLNDNFSGYFHQLQCKYVNNKTKNKGKHFRGKFAFVAHSY